MYKMTLNTNVHTQYTLCQSSFAVETVSCKSILCVNYRAECFAHTGCAINVILSFPHTATWQVEIEAITFLGLEDK